MPGEAEKLTKALESKEECEGFISNLEQLKSSGSVTPEIYSSLTIEYDQKLKASLSEIDKVKKDIKNLLTASLQEKDVLTDALTKLEIRYKVNEITEKEYQKSRNELKGKIGHLNKYCDELSKLLETKSSRDVSLPIEEIRATPSEAPLPTREISTGKRFKLPSRRILMAIGAAVALIVLILIAVLLIPGGGKQTEEVTIPVDIVGAKNIGSIRIELIYDSILLEPVSVKSGTVTVNDLFESNINDEGRVIVGLVSSAGISGDGSIAEITFKIKGRDNEPTPLVLDNVSAYSSLDLSRLSVSFIAGSYKAKDNSFASPTVYFAAPPGK
jgi:hypothetical protein